MGRRGDVGAAVIGTGFIGTVHVEALRRIGVHVAGILGSSAARGAERAADMGVELAYHSLEELLEDESVRVVHVTSERAAETVAVTIETEDVATILLRFEGGARGVLAVSQVSPGRKNSLAYEIDGSAAAVAWDSEDPDHLWIGHRDVPNELLLRNPALMNEAGRAAARLPGGHVEGFADTFGAIFGAIYADVAAGAPQARPPYATFADGHEGMLVGDAVIESSRTGRWVQAAHP